MKNNSLFFALFLSILFLSSCYNDEDFIEDKKPQNDLEYTTPEDSEEDDTTDGSEGGIDDTEVTEEDTTEETNLDVPEGTMKVGSTTISPTTSTLVELSTSLTLNLMQASLSGAKTIQLVLTTSGEKEGSFSFGETFEAGSFIGSYSTMEGLSINNSEIVSGNLQLTHISGNKYKLVVDATLDNGQKVQINTTREFTSL
ncbi:MAG: hypothetical protein H6604_08105 [Flavobacteriales bacterium]|nr:hypothetical protein [Flavobacteriales bacterium]